MDENERRDRGVQENGLKDKTALHERSSGEAGDDKKRCGTRKVEDEELPFEGTAICARRTELVRGLGSDVDDGLGQQS